MRVAALTVVLWMVFSMVAVCYVAWNIDDWRNDFQAYQGTQSLPDDFKPSDFSR